VPEDWEYNWDWQAEEIAVSPCIGVCDLDDATGLCKGCKRTLPEVAAWPQMDDDERRRIMAELDSRG
jgi:predicted Fe-S protein YdhL (DUF1289 family)